MSREVIPLRRDSELEELWLDSRRFQSNSRLTQTSPCKALSLRGETFSPAVTNALNWGTANLIIAMSAMADTQKRRLEAIKRTDLLMFPFSTVNRNQSPL